MPVSTFSWGFGRPEDGDEYRSHNVFWVPPEARWESIQAQAKLPEIGQVIDTAMDLIERENPVIRGVLPRNYGRRASTRDASASSRAPVPLLGQSRSTPVLPFRQACFASRQRPLTLVR